jgi:hypothetical protein
LELKDARERSLFHSLKSFLAFFEKFIKKINPFIKDYWQTMIFESEAEVFRKFWYIYRINEWHPVGKSKSFLAEKYSNLADAKLLVISTWEAEATWCRRSLERFSDKSYTAVEFHLAPSLVWSYSKSLNIYLRAKDKFIPQGDIPPLKKDNFHAPNFTQRAGKLRDLVQKAEVLASAMLIAEKDANAVLQKYNFAETLNFSEAELSPCPDNGFLKHLGITGLGNFSMVYKRADEKASAGAVQYLYFVLKEGVYLADIIKAILDLDFVSKTRGFKYELYTFGFYSLLFDPFSKELIYREKDIRLQEHPPFLRERFMLRALSFSLQLKLALKEDADVKLLLLFWQLLRARLFLAKGYFCVKKETISQMCRKESDLFSGYNNVFWELIEGRFVKTGDLFDINERIKNDIFSLL